MVVYIDLLFAMNLLIDASLILVTAWMRKQKVILWRLALSAAVGAMYVVMMFLPELGFMYTFLVKFLFSVVMLWIAFGFRSLQNYLRNMGAFYIVNFAAAGGILGLHYLLQDSGAIWSGMWYSASGGLGFSLKIGSLFTLVCFIAVLLWFKGVLAARQRQERISSFLAEVEVRVGETVVSCTGLIDTGNQLSDPLSRLPVMVMEASLWEMVLPPSYRGKLANERADNLILEWTEAGDFPWPERLRLVPYRGINKGTQFMLALKPDEATVKLEGRDYRSVRVLIGLDGGRLSTEGAYRAIVHPALVETADSSQTLAETAPEVPLVAETHESRGFQQ